MLKKIDLKRIKLFVYDFDGVMTDNRVLVLEDGREAVFCNRADGLAIEAIKKMGIPQIIVSTETNKVVEARARKLGINVIHGIVNKENVLKDYCLKAGYDLKTVVYVGNDVNDLGPMKLVGYPIAPKDADDRVRSISKIVVEKNGGQGVIKEIFDRILNF